MTTRRTPTSPNALRAFTLVELMMVVAIVGIVAAAGGLYISSPRDPKALNGASAEVGGLIQQLRNRAMSNGRAVILRLEETEELPDPGQTVGVGRGSGRASITITDAQGASCTPVEADPLIPVMTMNPVDPQRPYRHAVITRLAPATTDGVMTLCFTPSGRVVDPATSRPVGSVGSARFGGQAYIELRPVLCDDGACTLRPSRTTLAIEFNGLVERMPEDFDLGTL